MNKVRVLIVDDLKSVRNGLRDILELYDEIEIVGEASNGQEAIVLAKVLHPNIIVMDVKMPIMDGFEATHQIKRQKLADKVFILSIDNSSQTRQSAFEVGADAFFEKSTSTSQLLETILQFNE